MSINNLKNDATDLSLAKLRQLNKIIPKLLQASYFNQAKETKKLILATLKPSSAFMASVNDLPPNYLEEVIAIYKDQALAAYSDGQKLFSEKEEQIKAAIKDMVLKEQVSAHIRSKYAIDPILCDELCSVFRLNTAKYLKTLLNKDNIYLAFQKDMNNFFCNALIDATVLQIKNIKAEIESDEEQSGDANKNPTSKIEQYTKLLGPKNEDVLRVTLGLPPRKKIKAGFVSEKMTDKESCTFIAAEKLEELIEDLSIQEVEEHVPAKKTYHPQETKELVMELVKSHEFDGGDDELGYVIIDCLVPSVDEMSDDDLLATLKSKLHLKSDSPFDLDNELDLIASSLSTEVALPGEFVFTEVDGDFCLVFTFSKESALEMIRPQMATAARKSKIVPKEKKNKTVGDLPETADNLIPYAHQKEIKDLSLLEGQFKNMNLRSIRKASPTLSALISGIFSMLRSGKMTMGEAAKRFFGASNEALIEEAFGVGGKNYYLYVKQK
jgi:hypothetical protein